MTTLDEIRQPVNEALCELDRMVERHFADDKSPVAEMLAYALAARGKGVRPLTVLLSAAACSATGRVSTRAQLAAMLVEMIHVASLVHDDVIDESMMRRGRPSVNARWQSRNAVVVGDYILARAVSVGLSSAQYDLVQHITGSIAVLCEGEVLQSRHAAARDTDRESYLEIIRRKTASLLAVSASSGALAAGAAPERVEAMRRYGELLGMAFQIKDDIMDYTSACSATGKPACNDLREGKITLPLIEVLEPAGEAHRRELLDALAECGGDASKIDFVRSAVEREGGIERASEVMKAYLQRALSVLAGLPPSQYRDALALLCTYVAERER